jgi:hypothetical protein
VLALARQMRRALNSRRPPPSAKEFHAGWRPIARKSSWAGVWMSAIGGAGVALPLGPTTGVRSQFTSWLFRP